MYKYLFLLLPLTSSAQVRWTKARTLNERLPFSIQVYLTQDSVHGRPFRACYVEIDPYDQKIDFTARVGEGTPSTLFAAETGLPPYIVVNGPQYDSATRKNLQLVINDQRLICLNQSAIFDDSVYRYVTPSALGINGARHVDVGWVFTDSSKDYPLLMLKGPADPRYSKGHKTNPSQFDLHAENANAEIGAKTMQWPMLTAIGGGPTLIKRGQVFISSREEVRFAGHENDLTARTAMGYTRDNKLIILVIESGYPESTGATLPETAAILHDLHCWEALNLSGGPATCLLIDGQPILRPQSGAEATVGAVFEVKSHF